MNDQERAMKYRGINDNYQQGNNYQQGGSNNDYGYKSGGHQQQKRTFSNYGYNNRQSSPFNGELRPPFVPKCHTCGMKINEEGHGSGKRQFFAHEGKIEMKKLSDLSLTDAEKTRQVLESSNRFGMLGQEAREAATKEVEDKVMSSIGTNRDKSK